MAMGGKAMQDLGGGIDNIFGKHPRKGSTYTTRPVSMKDDPQPERRLPRQPSQHQKYTSTSLGNYAGDGQIQGMREQPQSGQELATLDDITPDEIYKIYKERADKTNAVSEDVRRRRREEQRKLLPSEMIEQLERNTEEIEVTMAAVEGHKQTVSNSFAVYGENGKWEDLKEVGDKWSKAYREQDAYSAFVHGNNFINGVMSIMPAMLQIMLKYEEVIPKCRENYEMLLELYQDSTKKYADLVEKFNMYEPKKIIEELRKDNAVLQMQLMRASITPGKSPAASSVQQPPLDAGSGADEEPEEEVKGPKCIGSYDKEDGACEPDSCSHSKECKRLARDKIVEEPDVEVSPETHGAVAKMKMRK